jgi:hypothetical protein
MANTFKDISQFTLKSAATGTEEFQVSATEKVTAQQIANLFNAMQAKMAGLTALTVGMPSITSDSTILSAIQALYKLSGNGKVLTVSNPSLGKFGFVSFTANAAAGVLFHLNSGSVRTTKMYVNSTGMTGGDSRTDAQWISWLEGGTVIDLSRNNAPQVVEITDFAIPGLNITKDGESFLFYANNAINIPNSNYRATLFVGVAIASPIFITGDQRFLYYMMIDTAGGVFYTGRANLEDDAVAWNTTPVTRLGQAVQVTAFTEPALSALLYSYKPGDFIPFFTNSVTASEANQFPESGIFNGFISMGRNGGHCFQIFAFKTGSPNAYIGACIGSTTRWTQIGGSSSNLIVVADAENVGGVVAAYKGFEGSNKYGVSVPIYIEATSNIYDELPAIMDQSFTKNESTICGYAQYVYDGGDYYHIGLSLLIYPSSGDRPKYRAELVVNNSGEVVSSSLTPIGNARAPIPGFTKITSLAGQTDYSLTTGSMGVINFSTEVNANTIMFIEAEVRSSAAISAEVRSVCIPVSFFNPKQGATLMDLNTRTLASGTNIAQVRLNVASVVTGANGVQGLNCVVTSNNLANPSDILRIKAVYANI